MAFARMYRSDGRLFDGSKLKMSLKFYTASIYSYCVLHIISSVNLPDIHNKRNISDTSDSSLWNSCCMLITVRLQIAVTLSDLRRFMVISSDGRSSRSPSFSFIEGVFTAITKTE